MPHIKTTFLILVLSVFLIGGADCVLAFKGMGSSQPGVARESMTSTATQHQGNQDTVVAKVNGVDIKMGPLMGKVMDVILQKYGGKEVTSEIARSIRKEALEKLAMEELAWQRAKAIGITINEDDVNARVEALKARAGGEEAFKNSLARQNKSVDDLKKEIRRFMAVKAALKKEVDSKVTVDKEEINRIYQENKADFIIPEVMVVSDIVFFLDTEDPGARPKVESIRQRIITELDNNLSKLSPEGFVINRAFKISQKTEPDLYQAAINMNPGEISPPVIINATYHLVKLEQYNPATEKPEAEVKAYIGSKLKSRKREQLLIEWRQSLLKDANIEIVHELLQ